MSTWTNFDGLDQHFGLTRAVKSAGGANAVQATKHVSLELDLTSDRMDLAQVDGRDAQIPAGAYIKSAHVVVTEAAAGGTSVGIGLATPAGVAIDADGIDAAIATADLGADEAVACDGALVGGTATIGSTAGIVYVVRTGTFTAGKANLVIEYVV